MKKIYGFVKDYLCSVDKRVLLFSTLFTALAVWINYHFHLNEKILRLKDGGAYLAWFAVFFVIFSGGYLLQQRFVKSGLFAHRKFILLLLLAPAIFAFKMSFSLSFLFSGDPWRNEYWNAVVYWPLRVVILTGVLWWVRRLFNGGQTFYGLTLKNFSAKPYLLMLLLMIPLIVLASTQHDFLRMYPRLHNLVFLRPPGNNFYKVLYELSYGSDFFSIELFFRGFCVLSFARWAGRDVILPMAMFYCTIHFGKPLGECISSYFGGMILGVVAYHTRSIVGGFLVHVGIAWLMELIPLLMAASVAAAG